MTEPSIDLKLFSDVKELLHWSSIVHTQEKLGKPSAIAGSYSAPPKPPKNAFDEVFPGIWLGVAKSAKRPGELKRIGITHVVNSSMGSKTNQTDTNSEYYKEHNISFHGIPALDTVRFKILPHLHSAAEFIEEALADNGKVYVHCQRGISRSATTVLAFLMLKRNMDLFSAVKLVREKREILPNDGFLKQLCQLNQEIHFTDTPDETKTSIE